MRLILTLVEGGSGLPDNERKRILSSSAARTTLTIGRGPDNDWILNDRTISRTHCSIDFAGGRFGVTDRSTNGLYINHAPVPPESRMILNEGDTIALGTYVAAVALIDDAPVTDREGADRPGDGAGRAANGAGRRALQDDPLVDPPRRPTVPSSIPPDIHVAPVRRGADPFETTHRRPTTPANLDVDPFEERLAGARPQPMRNGFPQSDHAPATAQAIAPQRVVSSRKIDFDALIGDVPGAVPMAPDVTPVLPRPALPDPVLDPEPPRPETRRTAPPPEEEWRELSREPPNTAPVDRSLESSINPFTEEAPAPAPVPAMQLDAERAEPIQASDSEDAQRISRPSGNSRERTSEPRSNLDAEQALAAFLEGAGVSRDRIDATDPEATLRAAGMIFRAMTEGFQQVLKSRAAVKKDMRVDQTIVSGSGNNSLKFAVTTDDAVRLLLTPKTPGYMEPLASARQAAKDIEAHELAVMVGMQQALLSLLRRFNPDELEKRLVSGGLGGLLPAARKARCWDTFRHTYGDLSREVEDEFHAVFGLPFAKAYNAQTRKE